MPKMYSLNSEASIFPRRMSAADRRCRSSCGSVSRGTREPPASTLGPGAATLTTTLYSGPFVEDLRLAVTRAGLRFEPILIGGPSEFRSAFATMAKAEAQAVIVMPFFDPHRVILVELAAKHRLAYMSGSRDATAAGGLVSMAANFPELYERGPRSTSTKSSRALSPPIYRWSSPQNFRWRSI